MNEPQGTQDPKAEGAKQDNIVDKSKVPEGKEPESYTVDSLINKIEDKLNPEGNDNYSGALDNYDIANNYLPDHDSDNDDRDSDNDLDNDDLKKRLGRLEKENRSLKTRGKLREVLGRVEANYSNAYRPTIERAIREGTSPQSIERIAQASHNDYVRGYKVGLREFKAELDKIRQNATREAEVKASDRWGSPPQSSKQSGDAISYEQFRKAVKSGKLNEAELSALTKRLK